MLNDVSNVSRYHVLQFTFVLFIGVAATSAILHVVNSSASVTLPPASVSVEGAIIPLLLAFFTGILILSPRREPANAIDIYVLGFSIRLVLSFLLSYTYQFQDEVLLHQQGEVLASCSVECWVNVMSEGRGYPALLGIFYSIFGVNLLVPKILNSALGSILPFLIADIVSKLYPSSSAASRSLYFSMFLPPLLLYSAMNLKELPSTFLLVLTFWVLMIPRRSIFFRSAFAVLVILATYCLRSGWAFFPLVALVSYLIFAERQRLQIFSMKRALGLVLLAIVIAFPLRSVMDGAIEYFNYRIFIGADAAFGTLQNSQSVTASLLDTADPWSIKNMAIQLARAPFSPSPLLILSRPSLIAVVDSLIAITQYILMPFAIIGFLKMWRSGEVMALGLVEAAILSTSGLSLMLGLTIQRHVVPHFAIVYMLASIGLRHWQSYAWVLWGWIVVAVVYTILYGVTKI